MESNSDGEGSQHKRGKKDFQDYVLDDTISGGNEQGRCYTCTFVVLQYVDSVQFYFYLIIAFVKKQLKIDLMDEGRSMDGSRIL